MSILFHSVDEASDKDCAKGIPPKRTATEINPADIAADEARFQKTVHAIKDPKGLGQKLVLSFKFSVSELQALIALHPEATHVKVSAAEDKNGNFDYYLEADSSAVQAQKAGHSKSGGIILKACCHVPPQ